jgi:hypothetical protein
LGAKGIGIEAHDNIMDLGTVNYNDLTATSLENLMENLMVSKGNHPQFGGLNSGQ